MQTFQTKWQTTDHMSIAKPVHVFQESIIDMLQHVTSNLVGHRDFDKAYCFRSFEAFLSPSAIRDEKLRRNYAAEVQALLAKRRTIAKGNVHEEDNVDSVDQLIEKLEPFKEDREELLKILFFLLLIEKQRQPYSNQAERTYNFWRCLKAPSPLTSRYNAYGFNVCLQEPDATDTSFDAADPLCFLPSNVQHHMRNALSHCPRQQSTKKARLLTCYEPALTATMLNDLYMNASFEAYLKNKGSFPSSIVYLSFVHLKYFLRRLFNGISSELFVYNKADEMFTLNARISMDGIMFDSFESSIAALLEAGAYSRRIRTITCLRRKPFCRTIEMFLSALHDAYCENLKTSLKIITQANSIVSLLINLRSPNRWLCFFGKIASALQRHLQETNGSANVCWLWNTLYNSSFLCTHGDSFLTSSLHYCMQHSLTPFLRTLEIAVNDYKWYDPYQEFPWLQCAYLTGNGKENDEETLEDFCYFPPQDLPTFIARRVATLFSYFRYCFILKKRAKLSQMEDFKFAKEPVRLWKEKYEFSKVTGQEETILTTSPDASLTYALEQFFDDKFSEETFRPVDSCLWHYYVVNLDVLGVLTSCNRIFFGGDSTSTVWPIFEESLFPLIASGMHPSKVVNHPLVKDAARYISQMSGTLKANLTLNNVPPKFDLDNDRVFDSIKPTFQLSWLLSMVLLEGSIRNYEKIWSILCYSNFSVWHARTICNDLLRSARSPEPPCSVNCCTHMNNVHKLATDLNSFLADEITIASAGFADIMKETKSIDHLRRAHIDSLNAILSRCFICSPAIHSCFMDIFKATVACCQSVRCGDLQATAKYSRLTVQRAGQLCIELESQKEDDLRITANRLLARIDTSHFFADRITRHE